MYTWWFPESGGQSYGGDMYSGGPPFQPNLNVDDPDTTRDQMS
jgi:hypothetical protein